MKPKKKEEVVCSSCRLTAKFFEDFRKLQTLKVQSLMRTGNRRSTPLRMGVTNFGPHLISEAPLLAITIYYRP